MNSERLKILNMLQEGRITCSEAAELLNVIDPLKKKNAEYDNRAINDSLSSSIENVIADFNKNTGSISEELSKKFSGMDKKLQGAMNVSLDQLTANMKSLEQNLKSIIDGISRDLGSSTASLPTKLREEASNLSDLVGEKGREDMGKLSRSMKEMQNNLGGIPIDPSSLADSLSGIFTGLIQNTGSSRVISELYKKNIDDTSFINLKFEAVRGSLFLERYEGSEIETEVYCRTPYGNQSEAVSVTDEDDTYGINPVSSDSTSIQLDIRVPEKTFNEVSVSTTDGKVEVSDIACKCLFCTASRSKISLSNLSCDIIEAGTSEGQVSLSGIKCKKIFVSTHNSPIIIDGTSCRSSDIITVNGSITMELNDNVLGNNEYKLRTENAPIAVELNIPNYTGIFIDARSENGNIKLDGIPNFLYKVNDRESGSSHIVGQTSDFEKSENTIRIIAKTKNSQINFIGNQV